MITSDRCSTCGRVLALTRDGQARGKQYCPDRPCIYYPAVSTSRAEDPTISAWALAVHSTTSASPVAVSRAMGHAHSWLRYSATKQRQRWTSFQ